jgi:putative copper resistance protein D
MLDALAALTKALLYAGLLTCAGVAFAAATLRVPVDLADFTTRTIRRGALVTILAVIAGAMVLALRLGGSFDEVTLSAIFVSGSGAATALQLAGAMLLFSSADEPTHGMKVANAALMTLSFAFTGHAGAMGVTDGLIASLHVSAAAWWVGALWYLWQARTHLRPVQIADLVRRFGTIATGVVGGLVIAGLVLVLALVRLEEFPALSAYESLLALKIGLAAAALGVAAYNRMRLTPRLMAGDGDASVALHRTVTAELVVIALVISTTAVLTTYTSPHE